MTAISVIKELTSKCTREVKKAYLGFNLMSVTEPFLRKTLTAKG